MGGAGKEITCSSCHSISRKRTALDLSSGEKEIINAFAMHERSAAAPSHLPDEFQFVARSMLTGMNAFNMPVMNMKCLGPLNDSTIVPYAAAVESDGGKVDPLRGEPFAALPAAISGENGSAGAGALDSYVRDLHHRMGIDGLEGRIKQLSSGEDEHYARMKEAIKARYVARTVISCHDGNYRDPELVRQEQTALKALDEARSSDVDVLTDIRDRLVKKLEDNVLLAVRTALSPEDAKRIDLALSADVHSVFATILESLGEKDAAMRQFALAGNQAAEQTDAVFYQLRAMQQLSGRELAGWRNELRDILEKKLPALESVARKTEARFAAVEKTSRATEELVGRLMMAEDESHIAALMREFEGEHGEEFSALADPSDSVPMPVLPMLEDRSDGVSMRGFADPMGGGFVPGLQGADQEEMAVYADRRPPGSAEKVHPTWTLAWKLLYEAEQSAEEPDLDALLELDGKFFRKVGDRVAETKGHVPLQESVLYAGNAGQILMRATSRMGRIEKELLDGGRGKAEGAFDFYRRGAETVMRSMAEHAEGDSGAWVREMIAGLDMRLNFDGRMAMHRYVDAMDGSLPRLIKEHGDTESAQDRFKALKELYPDHFTREGAVLAGVDFSKTDEGRDAAARERSLYLTNGDITTDMLVTAAGSLAGAGLGCVVGGIICGAAGTVEPGGGNAAGATIGCKVGAYIGGVLGGAGSEAANMAYNVSRHADDVEAARRSGVTLVTRQEHDRYRMMAGVYLGGAAASGLLFARPGMLLGGSAIKASSAVAGRYVAAGGARGIAEAASGAIRSGIRATGDVFRFTFESPRLAFATAAEGAGGMMERGIEGLTRHISQFEIKSEVPKAMLRFLFGTGGARLSEAELKQSFWIRQLIIHGMRAAEDGSLKFQSWRKG
ncbi:MAG: hypothetical protein V2A66_01260, partial [Pseudomonadota bacterium]